MSRNAAFSSWHRSTFRNSGWPISCWARRSRRASALAPASFSMKPTVKISMPSFFISSQRCVAYALDRPAWPPVVSPFLGAVVPQRLSVAAAALLGEHARGQRTVDPPRLHRRMLGLLLVGPDFEHGSAYAGRNCAAAARRWRRGRAPPRPGRSAAYCGARRTCTICRPGRPRTRRRNPSAPDRRGTPISPR